MRKIFFMTLFLTVAGADSLPLVHYDPFYKSQIILHTHTPIKIQNRSLVLSAIFNNRAFINNRFYTMGEKIQGYKVIKIREHSVVLQNRNTIKVLHLQQKHLLQIKQAKREQK